MPKTLTLPDDLYKALKQKSKNKGMMPEEYALELLKNETAIKSGKNVFGLSAHLYNMVRDLRLGKHKLSKEEARRLDIELRKASESQPSSFPTVEDAMSWSRGYPWRKDDSN